MPPEPQDPRQPHKRRVRYRGTHPRRFEEKYKELDPDKFADDVKRIIARGRTPAGPRKKAGPAEFIGRSLRSRL